jgi:hypothetical protein
VNRRAKIKPATVRQRPFIDQKLSSHSARTFHPFAISAVVVSQGQGAFGGVIS